MVEAVKKGDRAALVAVLGKEAEGSLSSGDKVADRITAERFIARYETKHAIVADGDSRATLTIDADDFPFAFPLVKTAAGWRFDAKAGNAELLARRVGENELAVMNVLLAIVDAQREYASLIVVATAPRSTPRGSRAPRVRRTACTGPLCWRTT